VYPDALVFAIAGAPPTPGHPALAAKLRDLTISWSRYDYRGRILEDATVEGVLDQAVELGYRWCLVQEPGHLILERWHADAAHERFALSVMRLIDEREFLMLGAVVGDDFRGHRLDDQCLVVDVGRYAELGRPAGSELADVSLRNGLPVHDLGAVFEGRRLALGRQGRRLARYLGNGILSYGDRETGLDAETGAFLADVRRQVADAPRGVFLWNLEPYDDVQTTPQGFEPPVSSLYCVASGFKPNMILESLGFDDRTRVVFFDYSANALEVKRLLLDDWDGRDFPAFARRLFRKVPSRVAYYHLWDGATPETLDWTTMERAWERELELWGGERAFEEHWSRYRRLRHEFVVCDLLESATPLLARVEPERDAVVWWSNAFFTVRGNWLYEADERRRLYERWIDGLAERNPELFLYGSDFCNSSVNDIRAREYLALLRDTSPNELVPLGAGAVEIRF
jgi:hypothetical protein